ncbi:MAG: type II secretion system protein M [Pseudomonadales bacterium]|nr:type II secretion system protein M [Pseudomonadales bacterium]
MNSSIKFNFDKLRERFDDELEQSIAKVKTNQNYQRLEQRYNSLTDRDRSFVNVAAFLLVVFLAYRIIVGPALGYLGSASGAFQKQLENYEWMVAQEPKTRELLDAGGATREGSLLSIASGTAKNHELTFSRFEPIGDDRVRLWLEQVKFNNVVNWLGELETNQGVSAIDISVDSAAPGYVSVRLTLQG